MSSSTLWLLLATCLVLGGCGGGDEIAGDGGEIHHRVHLSPALGAGEALALKPSVLKRYEADPDHLNRTFSAKGAFDTKEFNQVVVSMTSAKKGRAKLVFFKEGKRVYGVPAVPLARSSQPQIVIFELPALRRRDLDIDELQVVVEGSKPQYRFHSLDLVSLPLHMMLPGTGGELFNLGDEARRVVGLTSYLPLEGVAPLGPNARLTFSVLHPEEHRYPGHQPKFNVTARDDDGAEVNRVIELDARINEQAAWVPISMDLSSLKGGSVRIEVSLEVDGLVPVACLLESPYLSTHEENAPTILLVTSDTHRADVMGISGSEFEVSTPNLDALAARGVRFVDCFSSTNVTSPSHVAIMTGAPPRDTGILTNIGHMAEAAITLAELFRDHGYVTMAAVSVRHLGPLGTGLGQGFDRIAAPRSQVWDAEISVDVIESWLPEAEGRPLFAWLHLFDAHAPYGPPGEFDGRYYPLDKDPFDDASNSGEELHPRWLNGAVRGLKDPAYALTQYRAEVDYLDQQLGRLLNRSRFQRGIVAFTGDHGESFGAGGVWFDHVGLFPETLHVPLILAWAGGPEGLVVEAPVEHIHLGRTILDLAGFQADDFPGQTLMAAIEGRSAVVPRFSFSANGKCAAIMHDGWQLTLNLRAHDYHGLLARAHHQVELFKISTDPGCLVDLVDEEPEQAATLRRSLIAWLADTRGSSWARAGSEDADALAQLAALGYTMDVPETDDRVWFELDCECAWCARYDD